MTKINKKLKKSDIRNIIFEKINDKFSYGRYGPFNVIMISKNGYINATKLCQLDEKKRFTDWKANKRSKMLISELSKLFNISENELIININGGSNTKISGTYVHPEIILDIALWISLKFRLIVSKIIKKNFSRNVMKEKKKLMKKCKEKDEKINTLSKKIDKQSSEMKKQTFEMKQQTKKIDTLLDKNNQLLDENKDISKNVKQLKHQNKKLLLKQDEILEKTEIICDNYVVLTGNKGDKNHLLIVKNNDTDTDDSDDEGIEKYEYTVFKMQENIIKKTIAKRLSTYPNSEIILDIINPNARTLWKNVRLTLKKKIHCKNTNFNLKHNYTQNQLIKDIKKIHNERLEHNFNSDDD